MSMKREWAYCLARDLEQHWRGARGEEATQNTAQAMASTSRLSLQMIPDHSTPTHVDLCRIQRGRMTVRVGEKAGTGS